MRHGKKINHLGRNKSHREAMLSNMACSLIEHKRINTTLAKAKALRVFIEPIITKSKNDITHNRRLAFKKLRNKDAVTELFKHIASKIADRKGGYTRVIKLGFRLGDAAEMAMIELVDYNTIYTSKKVDKSASKTKSTRRGGRKQKVSKAVEQTTDVTQDKNDVVIDSEALPTSSVEEKSKNDDALKEERTDDNS